jgi:DNA-binding NtrC family response regulator
MSTAARIKIVSIAEIPVEAPLGQIEKQIILVVDDEKVIADTLSIILSRSGFAVQTAYNAASALDLAKIIPPHLLLSDVMLGPGIDGTQLAIKVIECYPDCKVILFSGHAATSDLLARARELGHDFTLLSKPVYPADLLEQIGNCFGAVTAKANA